MAKFYVYTLAYPEQMGGAVFYVGKGTGGRMHTHEVYAANGETGPRADAIRAIWDAGYQIVKAKVYQTDDEQAAFDEEARLIAAHCLSPLTNQKKLVKPALPLTPEQIEWQIKCRIYAETTARLLRILTADYQMTPHDIASGVWGAAYKPNGRHINLYISGRSEAGWLQANEIAKLYTRLTGVSVDIPRP